MLKKIKMYLMFCAVLSSITVHASDTFYVNNKPGGLSGNLAEIISKSIKESGKGSADVKYLGNCKVGENIFNKQETKKAWVMNLAYATDIGDCKFLITPNTLVDVIYGQSASVCYQKDRKELGVKHFLDQSKRKIWMTTVQHKTATMTWVKDLGLLNSASVLAVGNSRDVTAASFGREGDYFTIDTTTAVEQKDRLNCLFSTSREEVSELGAPTLKKFSVKVRYPVVYASQIVVVSNAESKSTYQSLLIEAKKQPAWIKFINRPGIEVFEGKDQWQFFKEQQKLLNETALEDADKKNK